MALDFLLLFLLLVGTGASLSLILLAWKKTQWKGEDLRHQLRMEFLEEPQVVESFLGMRVVTDERLPRGFILDEVER
ncbi:MAG: hypothetical protein KAX31_03440 [Thermoplasmata archaeon]|nr:hypothetical protein [Thermoplasmata archaeon]